MLNCFKDTVFITTIAAKKGGKKKKKLNGTKRLITELSDNYEYLKNCYSEKIQYVHYLDDACLYTQEIYKYKIDVLR